MFFFIIVKIILTGAAFCLIVQGSPWLFFVFALFIIFDLIDGKAAGTLYRPYDTFFDRMFAYLCFFGFFIARNPLYPSIIYISAFFVRDYFLLGEIQKHGNYYMQSNWLDRVAMLATATLFCLQASGGQGVAGLSEIFSYLIASLILYQGIDKVNRIRETAKKLA